MATPYYWKGFKDGLLELDSEGSEEYEEAVCPYYEEWQIKEWVEGWNDAYFGDEYPV